MTIYGKIKSGKEELTPVVEVYPDPCEHDDTVYQIMFTPTKDSRAVDIAYKWAQLRGIGYYTWDQTTIGHEELAEYSYSEGAFYEVIQRMHEVYHIHGDVEKLRQGLEHETLGPLWLVDLEDPLAVHKWSHDTHYRHYKLTLTDKGQKALDTLPTEAEEVTQTAV